MRSFTFLLPLVLVLGLLGACRGPQDGDSAGALGTAAAGAEDAPAIRLELPDDPAVGAATFRVYLLDGGEGVRGAEVEMVGTMTHAGMAPVVRAAEEAEPGLYVADDFEFTMAGDWIVTAEATLPDGTEVDEEAVVTVRQP